MPLSPLLPPKPAAAAAASASSSEQRLPQCRGGYLDPAADLGRPLPPVAGSRGGPGAEALAQARAAIEACCALAPPPSSGSNGKAAAAALACPSSPPPAAASSWRRVAPAFWRPDAAALAPLVERELGVPVRVAALDRILSWRDRFSLS